MTLRSLLDVGEDSAPALHAPDRRSCTYAQLRAHVDRTVEALNTMGLGRGDRVAVVMSNGPEIAAAFLAVGSAAVFAPLNPAYRTDELRFFMSDLGAKALVVERPKHSAAVKVARELGVRIVELVSSIDRPAGSFDLVPITTDPRAPLSSGHGKDGDVALILYTSGTTSRPKVVPLTHANLTASAHSISKTLHLTPQDVCFNMMPLFHIHGLMASVLSTIAAGASVVATPGFNVLRAFPWIEKTRPTWLSAVPTMHQALLARADGHEGALAEVPLRLIRSSSSALAPTVFHELESVFRVPVIESYGMTEASHQITSNPLPPEARLVGTVGRAAGPEVAIMSDTGVLRSPGTEGEIVIRGPSVVRGYEGDAELNESPFTDGWFRTGDQGTIEAEGYLRITGRLKEMINRGGEKIAPVEVDNALVTHPGVAEAVTFALPHPLLGEEVAAAVVLRHGVELTERELRNHVAERLATFKVPKQVVIVKEIPKGPSGKPQRIGLADRWGLG